MSAAVQLGIIRRNGLSEAWGLGASAIADQVKAGVLTKPIEISERARGWPVEEIAAIRKARIAGATKDQIRELVKELHAARTAKAA